MTKEISGDEAILWGAREANFGYISSYPDILTKERLNKNYRVFSSQSPVIQLNRNGRNAFEQAIGASYGGERSLIYLKNSDFFSLIDTMIAVSLKRTKMKGFVIALIDDLPGRPEYVVDSRKFFPLLNIPLLEPSNPLEGFEMTCEAFLTSESYQLPVVLRLRPGYQAMVEQFEVDENEDIKHFHNDYIKIPRLETIHEDVDDKIASLRLLVEQSPFNNLIGHGAFRMIVSGFLFQKLQGIIGNNLDERYLILKLGTIYPLPEMMIKQLLHESDSVLVLEEGDPFIETMIQDVVHRYNLETRIYSRPKTNMSDTKELQTWELEELLNKFVPGYQANVVLFPYKEKETSIRNLPICAGCDFHTLFTALKKAISTIKGKRPLVLGDRGCPSLLDKSPYRLLDISNPPGSAIAVATGMSKHKPNEKFIVLTESESFFQEGINAFLMAIQSDVNMMVIILDKIGDDVVTCYRKGNEDMSIDLEESSRLSLHQILESYSNIDVFTVETEDFPDFEETFYRAYDYKGLSVIIARTKCIINHLIYES
ncbi:hypothetical protein JXB12_08315 [candidate division KSB1 bacterium]|nr:hypothetical protein [candidate division KSB1 bacterium]